MPLIEGAGRKAPLPTAAHAFIGLDALRGIAAIAVVVYHAHDLLGPTSWLPRAYLAVDLFFILSGFVLDHAYGSKLGCGLSTARFMRLRLERLYPAYAIASALGFAAFAVAMLRGSHVLASVDSLVWSFAFGVFFLPTPPALSSTQALYPLDPAAWSLCFELLVNTAFALLFLRLRGRALLGLVIVSAFGLCLQGWFAGSLDEGSGWPDFGTGLLRVTFSFFAGVTLHRWALTRRLVPALPVWSLALIVIASFAAPWKGVPGLVVECFCICVVYPLIITSAAAANSVHRRMCGWLGALSYPLYVLHTPLLFLYTGALVRVTQMPVEAMRPWGGLLALVGIVLLCWLVECSAERPILAALRRRRTGADFVLPTADISQ